MPLDIQMFRAHAGGSPDKIKESQRRRFESEAIVDEIIAKDTIWRRMTGDIDDLKKERNKVQKEVAIKMKAKEDAKDLVATIKVMGETIVDTENKQKELMKEITKMINTIGNIVEEGVPISNDEDDEVNGNRVEVKWGTPKTQAEAPLNHHDLLWRIGGYEPERGSQVAGHRGYFLTGPGVLLNQAFQMYGTSFLRAKGYTPIQPPYMMKKNIMAGVAQLEEFDEALYTVRGDDGNEGDTEKYLIATSEQPLCGYHMGEWMEEKALPIKYAGLSTCFRKEAGSHGKDTWGIFRVHQFEKVEQFVIVEGDIEKSREMHAEMSACAEEFYQSLGFPYQVINIVSGALNNAAIKKLDLECWFPGYNSYRELVSCSNCTDYQSRSMEIRSGVKKLGDREKKYVHMLNATLCATGRAICCLLENYQEADGVRIPEVLVPYMGGLTFLPFVRGSREDEKHGVKSTSASGAKKTASASASGDAKKGGEKKDASAPKKETPKPKESASAQVKAAPAPSSDDPLLKAIEAKGLEVRALKGKEPKDKEAINAAVAELLALKKQIADKGNSTAPPSTPASTVSNAPKEAKKKDESKPPAVPVLAPTYVTPAPQEPQGIDLPLYNKDGIVLQELDRRLVTYSFVTGYRVSKEDKKVYDKLKTASATSSMDEYKNIVRYMKHMSTYTEDEMSKF